MTEQQKAENELHIEDLKAKGLAGDHEAQGTMMRMGELKVDVDLVKWMDMPVKDKAGMFSLLAGNESPAERAQRATRISESLLSNGFVLNLKDAFRAGKILAEGGDLPSDIKVKSAGFTELANQSILAQRLIELGVPANKIGQVLKAAGAGGLENAFPQGAKPLAIRAAELDEKKVELEKLRYEKELEIAKRMAAAESRKGITDAQKAQLEEFKSYVEIAKAAGGKLPEDIKKGIIDKAAGALGMEATEVKDFFNFITGGTHYEYKPKVTDESKQAIDELTDEPAEEGDDTTEEETPSEKVDRTVGKKDEEDETSKGFQGFVQGLVGGKKRKPGI